MVNDFLNIENDDGKPSMYGVLNERSELQRFRDQHDESELDRMVSEFRDVWEPAFRYNHEDRFPVPLHPWKVLKMERRAYAEMNGGEWPSMEMRHSLRVVKDEYVDKWRDLAGI